MENKDVGSIINKLREPRIFEMAIFDWAISIVSALIIARVFKLNKTLTVALLLSIVPLSLIFHVLFKVDSRFLRYFNENKWVKVGVIGLSIYLVYIVAVKRKL